MFAKIVLGVLLGAFLSTSLSAKGILRENEILVSDLKNMKKELAGAPKWVFMDPKSPYEEMGVAYIPIKNKYLGIDQATLNAKLSMIMVFHEVFINYKKLFMEQFHESEATVLAIGDAYYNYLITKVKVVDTYINMKAEVAVVKIRIDGCRVDEIERYIKASIKNINDNELDYIGKVTLKELGDTCTAKPR
ncbi:hypothetical protein [Helicobacter cetorum]|uniref:Uncharacterized protein n=1 Tax=Helicobacter cetorum (strain ATCC BAA-429 / MIT 00-7128) TaxID=182217 RepID=I0EN63_HELC0|nr:hypothetical protein [Helicobacter cetorum]AFI04382.1 hypothetical protein HCW_05600 [Helicobacter cetorum MIT 00-7128]